LVEKPHIPKLEVSSQKSSDRPARNNVVIAIVNGLPPAPPPLR